MVPTQNLKLISVLIAEDKDGAAIGRKVHTVFDNMRKPVLLNPAISSANQWADTDLGNTSS